MNPVAPAELNQAQPSLMTSEWANGGNLPYTCTNSARMTPPITPWTSKLITIALVSESFFGTITISSLILLGKFDAG